SVERVKYLPQNYLETLCNELADQGSSTFDAELRKIIYTHVSEEEKIGFLSLDDLLHFKVSELETEQQQLIDVLSKINAEIVVVERKQSPDFRKSLEQQLDIKKKELTALEGAKPRRVEDPLECETVKQETIAATNRLTQLEKALNDIRNEETLARDKKAEATKSFARVIRILQAIRNHKKNHDQFTVELHAMLAEVDSDLKTEDILSLNIDTSAIEQLKIILTAISDAQEALLFGHEEGSLWKRRVSTEAEIKIIRDQLGEKQRLFLVYKDQLTQWEHSKIALEGHKDKVSTIAWLNAELEALNFLPTKHEELKNARLNTVRSLHEQIGKIVAEYRMLYQPVQGFVQSTTEIDMPLPLDFDVRIAEEGFQDRFFQQINRQARGSFAGIDESSTLVRSMLKETDFMDADALVNFVERIDGMLHFDQRESASKAVVSVTDQLRKDHNAEGLYDFLFGLQYLKPQYSLTYDGQEISQLSPGERGLLLLVFYLLVDKDDIPLVIDQPEENLDNQTIFKVLVKCIKIAKQRRQVIMVTHNPNLAVVCDAEQIIYADCDKTNRCFTYVSGAIESPQIRALVITILEGTEPAFVNRQKKYGL
ncbi:MAG: TrlF family AAA-like ATPase, partial [Nitrosospira sp.]